VGRGAWRRPAALTGRVDEQDQGHIEARSVELSPTFNNAFTLRGRVGELTAGARARIAAWTEPGTLVVVTHGANILPLTGVTPEEGGMVIVKPDPGSAAKLRTLGRIPPLPLGP
jgi:hypothetical protein